MSTQLALIQNDDIPQVEATKYIPTEVAFVKPFENQLTTIEGEFSKFVFDYSDKAQNEAARSLIAKLRKSKAAIEKAGKAERDPAIQYQRHVIAEEDKLVARVQKLIDQYDKPLKEWEAKDQQRKDAILARIEGMKVVAESIIDASSAQLQARLDELDAVNPDDGTFGEFYGEAFAARVVGIDYLKAAIATAKKREDDAAELERLRAESEARRKADEEAAAKLAAEQAEKERIEREVKEAAERAEAEAKRKAEDDARIAREREQAAEAERKRVEAEAAAREQVLKEQAAKAERDRVAAEATAKKAAEEAEARRQREAKEAEERQKAAVEAERQRQADEQARIAAEEAAKAADRAHRGKIHSKIVAAMIPILDRNIYTDDAKKTCEEQAKAVVIAICGDQIPELKILY